MDTVSLPLVYTACAKVNKPDWLLVCLTGAGRSVAVTLRAWQQSFVQQEWYSPLYQEKDLIFCLYWSYSDYFFLWFSLPKLNHKAAGSSYVRYCCDVLKVMMHWRNKARLKGIQYINAHSYSVSPVLLSPLFSCAVSNTTCIRALYHVLGSCYCKLGQLGAHIQDLSMLLWKGKVASHPGLALWSSH